MTTPRFLRLVFVVLASLLAALNASADPAKWAATIDEFIRADATTPPPRDAVLFVGSSSIRLWSTLATDFPGVPLINRGFGGSYLEDSVFYTDRIIVPYHPRLVVVYAGENDLAAGRTPERVFSDFKALRAKIHATLPTAKIIYLAIKESPVRASVREQVLATNALIRAACEKDGDCTFVDLATPLLDAAGKPRPELFRSDRLHLNADGYSIWTKVLAPYLKP